MAITVEQLIAQPGLDTRAVAGSAGLHREIGWAHVCELPEPWEWVSSGDLLMTTGLGVPASASEQVRYVRHLADVKVAGVAIGEDMEAPPLTQDMFDAADANALPLLLTRRDIPFIALARTVAEASARAERARIDQTVRVYELLRRSSALHTSLAELVSSLEQVVACDLFVTDPVSGQPLLHDRHVPQSVKKAMPRWGPHGLDEATVVHDLPGGGAAAVMSGPRPAMLIAIPRDGRAPDSTVLRHMAAVTALQQTWVFAERERARRLGSSLLAQLLDERLDLAVGTAQLEERGLASSSLLLAACSPGDNEDDLHQLHHTLDDAGSKHLMLARESVTYVLISNDQAALDALRAGLPPGSAAGISDPFSGPSDLPAAQRQARWALHRAQERKHALVRHSDDFGGSVFLSADREDTRAAARRVLGPLLQYDAGHDTNLIQTLRCFLEENRSWQRTSARMHLHKQTLVYRIGRIEKLTGHSLSDTGDVAELWLGLQAAAFSGLLED